MEFQIGTYSDKVLYDVMPMYVCHVLLGRQWKFNKVIYDGKSKTFTFEKNGRRHTLHSSKYVKPKEKVSVGKIIELICQHLIVNQGS